MTTKLLEEILSKENLEKACIAVVRNKGASGIDGMKVNELKGYICEHGESITQKPSYFTGSPRPRLILECHFK